MERCEHCGHCRDDHQDVCGLIVCPVQSVNGLAGFELRCFKPCEETTTCAVADQYDVVDDLPPYECVILETALPILLELDRRHPDANNHELAVRSAKRLFTEVVRNARRQDR